MTDEKAIEFQQVAALVCQDLDILLSIAEHEDDLVSLKKQIQMMHQAKEKYINDPRERQLRYNAVCMILGAVALGMVRNDPISDAVAREDQ